MIKKLRQAPSWLLTLLLLTIALSANAKFVLNNSIYYNISNGEAYVSDSLDKSITTVNILSEVVYNGDSYPVTSIDDFAFNGCLYLRSVTIPESVTSIGHYAFRDCASLSSLTIPEGVTTIGDNAFDGCSSLKSVTIPESVKFIGVSAFKNCSQLSSLIFNAVDCTECGGLSDNRAFPSLITSLTIGEKVTKIPSYAFSGCSLLTSVTIPEGVTSIGPYAFMDCSLLTSVNMPKSVTSIGSAAFESCRSLTSLNIPEGVTIIGSCAFYACSSIPSVIIPSGVTSIGFCTFQYCNSLTSVTIPESVTSIEDCAFQYCTSLTSVDIPDKVTTIGDFAFRSCISLTSVTIPESVTSIGGGAFESCSQLSSLIFNAVDCTKCGSYYSPAFSSSITSLTFGENVTKIPSSSFYRCSSLTYVSIPDCVTFLGSSAFEECSNLKSITIGNGVNSIGDWAFYGCSSLDYFSAGNNLKSIGKEAFCDCKAMTCFYSFAAEPPVCGEQALDDINKLDCTLYVPAKSRDEYEVAPQWKEFKIANITEDVLVESLTISPEMLIGKAGDIDTITATVEPANATRPQLNWTSEDETVATVDENGVVTYIKEGSTIITAHTTDGSSLSASIEVLVSVKDPVTGDSNANGVVNVADAVNTANYAVGNEVTIFDVVAADVNKDGKITLSDASATIELILNQPSVKTNNQAEVRRSAGSSEVIKVRDFEASEGDVVEIPVYLGDLREYVALQGEIVVPEGMTLIGAKAGCAVSGSHALATKMLGSNRMRFVLFNSANEVINTANGEVLTLTVRVNTVNQSPIEMQNVIAADAIAKEYRCASTGGANMQTTGLSEIAESDIRVEVENGTVMIYNADGLAINVYSADGTLEARFVSDMEVEKCELTPGVHIISVAGKSFKVIIK